MPARAVIDIEDKQVFKLREPLKQSRIDWRYNILTALCHSFETGGKGVEMGHDGRLGADIEYVEG